MSSRVTEITAVAPTIDPQKTAFKVLAAISFCHLLNDMAQSLLPALYPVLKQSFNLNFSQVGMITLTFQATASLLQPVVGMYTDRRPSPYSLSFGMGLTLIGLLLLAIAPSFGPLLLAAALLGFGSSVFHPESSRVARTASGGQHGLAQSLFQVGGNAGSALGPLLAAFIVVPRGQSSVAWFSLVALLGIVILTKIGAWSKRAIAAQNASSKGSPKSASLTPRGAALSIAILLALIFSKYFYLASITNYYTFYLIHRFHLSVQSAQVYLFVFLGAVAAGTIIGGPVGDRIGRKAVIWVSILGILPFTLILPHVNLFWTGILSVPIGVTLASAFPAIVVYAQEMLPGKIGVISGLFFGFAFGMAGVAAAVLGNVADRMGIDFVYQVCAFLPLIGLLTGFLPNPNKSSTPKIATA